MNHMNLPVEAYEIPDTIYNVKLRVKSSANRERYKKDLPPFDFTYVCIDVIAPDIQSAINKMWTLGFDQNIYEVFSVEKM